MSRFRLAERARDDLRAIVEFVVEASGPDRAEALLHAIYQGFDRIVEMPEIGHRREDLTDADLRFWPVFSYLIVYRPGTDPLDVARVLHGRQDAARGLK